MTASFDAKGKTRTAAFALVAVLAIGFGLSQPALAANNGNGNGNGNGNLTANNQSVSVDENSSVAITLTGSGPSGFTYVIGTQPTHGTLTGTAPNVTYTPATNYFGADSFTFHTHKANSDSTAATVSITVNEVVVVVPPLTCDPGFHVENDVCVQDVIVTPPLTCDLGFHVENDACVADTTTGGDSGSSDSGSSSGTNSTDTGSGSGDTGSGSGTNSSDTSSGSGSGTNPTDTGSGGANSTDTGTGSGTNSTDTGSSGGNTDTMKPHASANEEVYNAGFVLGEGLKAMLKGGPIPEDHSQSMYYLRPDGYVIFSAMAGVQDAGYTWNDLSEGQQVWIVLHFDELVSGGNN